MKLVSHFTMILAICSFFVVAEANKITSNGDQFRLRQKYRPEHFKSDARHIIQGARSLDDKIIVGGEEADVGRYPYIVSLLGKDGAFCGGSLVDSEWVLSAAHCAGHATHILIGHHDLYDIPDDAELRRILYEVRHPSYNAITRDNDVMMIKLALPSSFSSIQMHTGDEGDDINIIEGTDVTVMGWGATRSEGQVSDVLLEVEVQVTSNERCQAAYSNKPISDSMICAAAEGKDSCQGDSGGPLIIKGSDESTDLLVGIVSWGDGCASSDYPGVYARVEEVYDFITDTVESRDAPECDFPDDGLSYSDCDVENKCWIGDGICDGADYNSTGCNDEGGDCKWCTFPDDYFDYSNCDTALVCFIGDGVCNEDASSYACNYDGGDCKSECDFIDDGFDYSGCHIDRPCLIGDGNCDNVDGYNSPECNYEGGDCRFPDDTFDYSGCDIDFPAWIGDDICDPQYSKPECNYDGCDCNNKCVQVPSEESDETNGESEEAYNEESNSWYSWLVRILRILFLFLGT